MRIFDTIIIVISIASIVFAVIDSNWTAFCGWFVACLGHVQLLMTREG